MAPYDRSLLRLLDANMNRATEGLRVLEECARMLMNDAALTATAKAIRHDLGAIIRDDPLLDRSLPLARDTRMDVLKSGATTSETTRTDLVSLIRANAARVAEAVRALEEYSKLIVPAGAVRFKDIRFRAYDLEQRLVAAVVQTVSPVRPGPTAGIDHNRPVRRRSRPVHRNRLTSRNSRHRIRHGKTC